MKIELFGDIKILIGGNIIKENRSIVDFDIIDIDDMNIILDLLNDLQQKYNDGTFYAIIENGDFKYKLELLKWVNH